MNKRRKHRAQQAQRQIERTTYMSIPTGLPGGAPYQSQPQVPPDLAKRMRAQAHQRLYLPERLAAANARENPVGQYVRALWHTKLGLPAVKREESDDSSPGPN